MILYHITLYRIPSYSGQGPARAPDALGAHPVRGAGALPPNTNNTKKHKDSNTNIIT